MHRHLVCLLLLSDIVALRAACATAVFAVGSDAGMLGEARLYDGHSLAAPVDVTPYASFTGGARVASGDVNADGHPDLIVAPGAGLAAQIYLYDGVSAKPLGNFLAFSATFTGGVYVAAGDVDGDGHADIIVGAGAGGGPNVTVFSGANGSVLHSFFAYNAGFTGGVRVAAGDVNGDGHADIIVAPGPGGGPDIRIFDGVTLALLDEFYAYSPSFLGGVFVAVADLDGDGHADIITAPDAGGGPDIEAFSGINHASLGGFFAYTPGYTGGVRVAAGDVDGDGKPEIVTANGSGGTTEVKVFSWPGLGVLHDFDPFNTFSGGAFVAVPPPTDVIFVDGFESP